MPALEDLERIGQGREAEIFAWPEAHVVRLMRNRDRMPQLERERAAMRAAAGMVDIPVPTDLVTVDGRPGLVMERIDGRDLLSLMEKQPWTVVRFATLSGRLHASLLRSQAPSDLPDLRLSLQTRLEQDEGIPDPLREESLAILTDLPDGEALLHGDFHPGNVLHGRSRTVVIDWVGAARGDPLGDIALTRVLLSVGDLPPGSSRFLRALTTGGRHVVRWGYGRGLRQEMAIEPDLLRRWEIVRAAVRLGERIEPERPGLFRFLAQRGASSIRDER